ncbi:hypothetical protein B0H19DRAFT_1243091 [Mycena capillaripes]|nr:hypothetical protein B0H19DRAFT_1243091 [Mycena capillaripes]
MSLTCTFEDSDGGLEDRESLSSEEEWASTSDKASHSARPYSTPDGRSQASSVGRRAKEKLTALSGGRICLMTRESAPEVSIEAAHLLPRSVTAQLLTRLEFSWGLRWKQLHIDSTRNLLYIRVDMHRSFDKNGWFLLPEPDILQTILAFIKHRNQRTYKQVLTRKKYKYRIIPLQLFHDNIGVFRRISLEPDLAPDYDKIFPMTQECPPTVESHVNPFFAIANAGPKIQEHSDLLPSPWIGHADIQTLLFIWTMMKNAKPTQEWYKISYRGDGAGHGAEDKRGSNQPDRRRDGSPPSRHRTARFFSGAAGAGPYGDIAGRAVADLPELDQDDQTDTTVSDVLTHAAVRIVPVEDRTDFFQKWLHGVNCSAASPDVEMAAISDRDGFYGAVFQNNIHI